MNRMLTLGCLSLLTLSAASRAAGPAAPERGSLPETKKGIVWTFEADPKLPNVLIIGDSISIGYTLDVRKDLAGKANVYRPLSSDGKRTDNCSGTTYGLERLDHWLEGHKWEVIHFNFGLHDAKHVKHPGDAEISSNLSDPVQATPEQYGKNLQEIVARLKKTGARLVFATTTPVPVGAKGRTPDEPAKYNEVALKIMHDNNIPVDDLYGFILPNVEKYQHPKDVHFSPEGYQALARQVAKSIEEQLPKKQ